MVLPSKKEEGTFLGKHTCISIRTRLIWLFQLIGPTFINILLQNQYVTSPLPIFTDFNYLYLIVLCLLKLSISLCNDLKRC